MDLMDSNTVAANVTNATASPEDELTGELGLADAILTTTTLVVIMLGMGCTQTLPELWKILKRPFGIIIGFIVQFFLMPLVGFGLAHAFNLSDALAISTVIMTCCPGGSMSNLFAYWALADISLSICMTTCSTILAVGMMPLCIFMYTGKWTNEDTQIAIPYVNVATSLATILLPTAVGMLINWKFKKIAKYLTQICSILGLIGIFGGIALRAYANPEVYISSWEAWVVAAILPPIGFILAFLIATSIHYSFQRRRTVGIECGCQNLSLALTIINLSFPPGPLRADMQIIPSIYGPIMGAEAGLFVLACRLYFKFCQRKTKVDDQELVKEATMLDEADGGMAGGSGEMKLKEIEMNGHNNTAVDISEEKKPDETVIQDLEDKTVEETNGEVTFHI